MTEVTVVPRDFPNVGIPKTILEDMSKDEVEAMARNLQAQADWLRKWNDRRPEPQPKPGFFDGVPIPKSMDEYNWNVKTRPG